MNFGKNLKKAREDKKFSQEKLGEMVNVKASNISRYERGLVSPTVEMLIKLSNALEISVDELIFGSSAAMESDSSLDRVMVQRLKNIQHLNEQDKKLVIEFLDAFLTKRQMEKVLKN